MNPEEEPQDSTYLDRLAAMSLLRENMFLANPSTYAMTDIAEDLPGSLRGIGGALKNVLPSKAIISEDPEERKRQIQEAVAKVKASRGSNEGLGEEMASNALSMAKGSLVPGAALAAIFHVLGPRGITPKGIAAGYLKSKGLPLGWQSPVTPIRNLKKLFTRKGQAAKFLKNVMQDTAIGTTMAAATGAAVPAVAHATGVSDKALEEAQKIMEEQPYITSLPSAEMLSVIKQKRDEMHNGLEDKVKNIGLGAGLEAATQAAGSVTPVLLPAAGTALLNMVRGRGAAQGLNAKKLLRQIGRNAKGYAAFGAATGALGGAFTNNLIEDRMNEMHPDREQEKLNEQPPAGPYPA